MRTPALILVAVAATLPVAPASPKDAAKPAEGQVDASAQKIKELQKERIATLKKAVDAGFKLAQAARAEIRDAVEDRMALLQAELEGAEKESERVALYKEAADDLKAYEKMARAMFEAGRGTELTLLKVKARRLEVEIQLERAKAKEAKAGK